MNIHLDTAKQMLASGQISQEDYEALTTKPKSKYNAQKTEVDGITFDSKAEARRYSELKILERAHEIGGLKCQVKYSLDINGVHICNYLADFEYYEHLADRPTVEDVKGYKKGGAYSVFRLKKKLFRAIYGIEIMEIS